MGSTEPAAAMPPPGHSTNFSQNSDLWPSVIAVSVISMVIMTSAMIARLYVKAIQRKHMGREDYLSVFAVLTMVAWTVLYDVACHLGISKHLWNVRASAIPRIFNYLNICDILYVPMLLAAKFDILLQLRRCSTSEICPKNNMKWLIYVTGFVTFGYYFSCLFQVAFECVPRKGLWDPSIHPKCLNAATVTFAAGGFGLLTDLMLYALLVWIMAIAGPKRLGGWLGLCIINIVALFGISTAAATLYYRAPFVDPNLDFSYHVAIVGIWAMAEDAAIILVGCMPSYRIWLRLRTERGAEKADTISGASA